MYRIAFDSHKHYTLASVQAEDGEIVREGRNRSWKREYCKVSWGLGGWDAGCC